MKKLIIFIYLLFSSASFAYDPPNGLPNTVAIGDYGQMIDKSTIIEADGYYSMYNSGKNRSNPPTGFYNKWISTDISLIKGQVFNVKISGDVSRSYNTIINFDPKIQALQNKINFQKGDSLELLINDNLSNGTGASNYVNQGCDIFTYPANTSSDVNAACNMYNATRVCRKSPSEENICTNSDGTIYGNWGIRGSGLKIWYKDVLINDNNKSFTEQTLIDSSLGIGIFSEAGFYIKNLTDDGVLSFKALDACDGSSNSSYQISSSNNNDSCFHNNLGNYAFSIKRIFNTVSNANTAPKSFGTLDFTIYSDDPNSTSDANLTIENLNAVAGTGYNTSANSSGKLWMRIHDDAPVMDIELLNYFNSKYNNSFSNRDNYYFSKIGRYVVDVRSAITDNTLSTLINKIVQPVKEAMSKASQRLYQNTISNVSFVKMIKTAMILYIIVYAICFMLGMVQVTQQDLVIRIAKMGVLFALIATDTSWNFFSKYLFNMFVAGSQNLIQIYTGGVPDDSASGVFRFIDISIGKFFTRYTWIKLSAILFNPVGFIVFIMIIYGMFVYIVCMIEMILGYLVAITAISFTIAIAPLFFACILFERTKTYFDNWLKYLLSFALQPVLLFAAVYLVYDLLLISFQNAIGYEIKWDVGFQVHVGIIKFDIYCYVAAGKSLSDLYRDVFISGLMFLMFVKVLRGMLDLAPLLTAYIVSTNSAPASITGGSSQARGQMDAAKELAKKATGLDQASKQLRKNSAGGGKK